jgi:hypothetical protein
MRSGSCGSYIQSLILLSLDKISRIARMEARPSMHEPSMSPVLRPNVLWLQSWTGRNWCYGIQDSNNISEHVRNFHVLRNRKIAISKLILTQQIAIFSFMNKMAVMTAIMFRVTLRSSDSRIVKYVGFGLNIENICKLE